MTERDLGRLESRMDTVEQWQRDTTVKLEAMHKDIIADKLERAEQKGGKKAVAGIAAAAGMAAGFLVNLVRLFGETHAK